MVPGLNSNVERNGAVFHVQSEDLGRSKPILQTLVYYGGEVVTILEYTYEALATSEAFSEEEVRQKLSDQHRRAITEIQAGVFDVVDPAALVRETEAEGRQRERILDYLERTLTYDTEPCPVPDTQDPAEQAVLEESRVEEVVEAVPVFDDSAALENGAEIEEAPICVRPQLDSRGTPVAESGSPRRLVVIRKDRDLRSEHAEEQDPNGVETPLVIAIHQVDEAPQTVAVRQSVPVHVVSEETQGVEGVLEQLDERLGQANPAAARSPRGRWAVVAVPIAALFLIAFGWNWFSATNDTSGAVVADARTVETAAPEIAVSPEPRNAPPPREVAPDAHAAAPSPAAPVQEPAATVQEDLAPVATGAGAEESPAEGQATAATLAPTIPEIPSGAPDPVERLEAEAEREPASVQAPKPPAAPAVKVRPGMLVELASVDRSPEPTVRAFPEYPKRARKKGHQGIVELSLLIDEQGNVADVRIADGGAESELSDAAIDAARGWKYTPARKGAYKVRVWKPVTVHFALDDHKQSRVRVEE